MRFLLLFLFLFSAFISAESSHTRFEKAQIEAINPLIQPYGVKCFSTQPLFVASPGLVKGHNTEFTCESIELDPYNVNINWQAPSTREDGAKLKADEILEYEIILTDNNGIRYLSSTSNHIEVNQVKGRISVSISTIDIDGLKSAPGNKQYIN
jgi:hypothetical protein